MNFFFQSEKFDPASLGNISHKLDDSSRSLVNVVSAQVKLDQVANALLAVRARNLIVEGHTDSQGSESYNQCLSQRRANAVRDYLVLGAKRKDLIGFQSGSDGQKHRLIKGFQSF